MTVPSKSRWRVSGSGSEAHFAVDDLYSTCWTPDAGGSLWLEIDLGESCTLGGLEVYWGTRFSKTFRIEASTDRQAWTLLCVTRYGEGGQDVFAFSATLARYVRWICEDPGDSAAPEIVEVNLYDPETAANVIEAGRIGALGCTPITIPPGESITVDLRRERSPLGALIAWGKNYGTIFSVHLSDDGTQFRELGRISTGDGDSDNFWWRSTKARFFRLTVHEASAPEGAVIEQLKLRVLNKDRMPIGQLEAAALNGRGDLYPQSLLGKQIYWTALGDPGDDDEALFDEFGNLEPRRGSPQIMPFLRLGKRLHAAPACEKIDHSLADGSLPIPTVMWSAKRVEMRVTALAHEGQACVEYRLTNRSRSRRKGSLTLAVRPVQINPYWQHGGHAVINTIEIDGTSLSLNEQPFAAFSVKPDAVAIVDFDAGDVIRRIESKTARTARKVASGSGLVSAACEFEFDLKPGRSVSYMVAACMREGVAPDASVKFARALKQVKKLWRSKLGARKLSVGDVDLSDTIETQLGLILVNATRLAFKPGPRNYDRTWIRDGSSQAMALLWAGLIDEAKAYVLWYAQRIYDLGLVPPILDIDGGVNHGYGSDIEFDAQGEFVLIAAEVYRITKDRAFLDAIFEPVVRATKFLEVLCERTNALHGPETRFFGILAPSISHEGYSKPSYSYWDDFFALAAWRNCEYLANQKGDASAAAWARSGGVAFASHLSRSVRLASQALNRGVLAASADREDVDPTSTSIAFEPCRVEDVLPAEYLKATYDLSANRIAEVMSPGFNGNFTPYALRNINAFVALDRFEDAFRILDGIMRSRRPSGWKHWAEVVWSDYRAADYIGDMPHTWIGAEFVTAIRRMLLREDDTTLELFRAVPDSWWGGKGIRLADLPTAFGRADLRASRSKSGATIKLELAGPLPERILVRYPGAKSAKSDGKPCEIQGDLITAPPFAQLQIRT